MVLFPSNVVPVVVVVVQLAAGNRSQFGHTLIPFFVQRCSRKWMDDTRIHGRLIVKRQTWFIAQHGGTVN